MDNYNTALAEDTDAAMHELIEKLNGQYGVEDILSSLKESIDYLEEFYK